MGTIRAATGYVDRILEMPRSFDHAILRFAREADVAGKTDQYGYYLVYIGGELWSRC